MKIKIIDTLYDIETRTSTVIINTDLGKFTGKAKLHEEDEDIQSSFAGYNYAEARAVIKYMKTKAKNIGFQIKGLKDCEQAMKNKKDYNHHSVEARTVRKQIKILEAERNTWKERVKSLHQKTYDQMSNRRKFLDDMIKHSKTKGDDK